MKNTIFTKILEETVIEVNGNTVDAIDKLIMQNGPCKQTITENTKVFFHCSKNGDFFVTDNNPNKIYSRRGNTLCYYVRGKVANENGKTLIKIYSVYSRSAKAFEYMSFGLCVAVIGYTLVSWLALGETISKADIFSKLVLAVLMVSVAFRVRKLTKNHKKDLAVMRDEAVRRAEAINSWDK